MKTIPLRDLLRQPSKVKALTAAGHAVRITDRGEPLWDISSAENADADGGSSPALAWEPILTELEAEVRQIDAPSLSAAKLMMNQRHECLR